MKQWRGLRTSSSSGRDRDVLPSNQQLVGVPPAPLLSTVVEVDDPPLKVESNDSVRAVLESVTCPVMGGDCSGRDNLFSSVMVFESGGDG